MEAEQPEQQPEQQLEQQPEQQPEQAEALAEWNGVTPLCCPLQVSFDDLPLIHYNVEGDETHYSDFMRRRMDRCFMLAPFMYYGHPVTPRAPSDAEHSHHIIRMLKESDPRYCVELLISDVNMYYKAFRRGTLDEQGNYQYSVWFRFKDFPLPVFLGVDGVDIVILSLDGGHGSCGKGVKVGGPDTMVAMFDTYVRHPDRPVPSDELTKITGRSIVVFSEAMRFWSAYFGTWDQLAIAPAEGSLVGGKTWNRFRSWKVICGSVLEVGRRGGGVVTEDDLEGLHVYKMTRFHKIISHGYYGELRLLLFADSLCVGPVGVALENPYAHRMANYHFGP